MARRGGDGCDLRDPCLPAELGALPLPPIVLQAGLVGEVAPLDEHGSPSGSAPRGDDGAVALVVIVVAEARRAEPPTLLYAALRGSCALGLASSSLRPTSRSDRP